jgi:membrane-bound lytic murein transglycosylase D
MKYMPKLYTLTLSTLLLFVVELNFATNSDTLSVNLPEIIEEKYCIEPDDPVLITLDNSLKSKYFETFRLITDTNLLDKVGFCKDSIPTYSEEYYMNFLAQLDAKTPFDLSYNQRVKAFIDLYALKRREMTSRMLGLSHTYFPMFEELLDKYDLPLEFKYLAVVESALNPKAKSKAGAVGLWQFMYPTGKMFKLNVTSYVDDRMDPYKSTEAACLYFKYLYGIYGNWELVMAAYNCGPGNVNKAIRRAGGKVDNYWDVWAYLPKETRSYVPAFIAVNYVMNNASAHNLFPLAPKATYFEFDTVHVKQELALEKIAEMLDVDIEHLAFLNPQYKLGIIPSPDSKQQFSLNLPKDKLGVFIANEQAIYEYHQNKADELQDATKEVIEEKNIAQTELITHKVANGEYLGLIAQKYGVNLNDLKQWNNIKGNDIYIGQKLTIYSSGIAKNQVKEISSSSEKYYTIQQGDTLWDIAKAKGMSVEELKKLNSNINYNNLKPGMKILVASSN